jgi:large subunit ribosomal protein L45
MWSNFRYKTIRWSLTETIEPPRVVHVVTREMLSKANVYGQATVRLHTKQVGRPPPTASHPLSNLF